MIYPLERHFLVRNVNYPSLKYFFTLEIEFYSVIDPGNLIQIISSEVNSGHIRIVYAGVHLGADMQFVRKKLNTLIYKYTIIVDSNMFTMDKDYNLSLCKKIIKILNKPLKGSAVPHGYVTYETSMYIKNLAVDLTHKSKVDALAEVLADDLIGLSRNPANARGIIREDEPSKTSYTTFSFTEASLNWWYVKNIILILQELYSYAQHNSLKTVKKTLYLNQVTNFPILWHFISLNKKIKDGSITRKEDK